MSKKEGRPGEEKQRKGEGGCRQSSPNFSSFFFHLASAWHLEGENCQERRRERREKKKKKIEAALLFWGRPSKKYSPHSRNKTDRRVQGKRERERKPDRYQFSSNFSSSSSS